MPILGSTVTAAPRYSRMTDEERAALAASLRLIGRLAELGTLRYLDIAKVANLGAIAAEANAAADDLEPPDCICEEIELAACERHQSELAQQLLPVPR